MLYGLVKDRGVKFTKIFCYTPHVLLPETTYEIQTNIFNGFFMLLKYIVKGKTHLAIETLFLHYHFKMDLTLLHKTITYLITRTDHFIVHSANL